MSRSSGKIMRPVCSLVDFILFDAFCLWCFQMFIVFTYINFFSATTVSSKDME